MSVRGAQGLHRRSEVVSYPFPPQPPSPFILHAMLLPASTGPFVRRVAATQRGHADLREERSADSALIRPPATFSRPREKVDSIRFRLGTATYENGLL